VPTGKGWGGVDASARVSAPFTQPLVRVTVAAASRRADPGGTIVRFPPSSDNRFATSQRTPPTSVTPAGLAICSAPSETSLVEVKACAPAPASRSVPDGAAIVPTFVALLRSVSVCVASDSVPPVTCSVSSTVASPPSCAVPLLFAMRNAGYVVPSIVCAPAPS